MIGKNISFSKIFSLFTLFAVVLSVVVWFFLFSGKFISDDVKATTFGAAASIDVLTAKSATQVIYHNSIYQIFYTSSTGNPDVHNVYTVTSTDGTTWSSPVSVISSVFATSSLDVKYSSSSGIISMSYLDDNHYLGFATSTNGFSFTTSTALSGQSSWTNLFNHVVNDGGTVAALFVVESRGAIQELEIVTSSLGGAWGNTSSIKYFGSASDDVIIIGAEIDNSNVIHLAYYHVDEGDNIPRGDLVYASSSNYGTTWTTSTIDSGLQYDTGVGLIGHKFATALTVDDSGNPALAYFYVDAVDTGTFNVTSSLRYARKSNGSWTTSTIDSGMGNVFVSGANYRYKPTIKIYNSNYAVIAYARPDGTYGPTLADNFAGGSFSTTSIAAVSSHFLEPGQLAMTIADPAGGDVVAVSYQKDDETLQFAKASITLPSSPTAPSSLAGISGQVNISSIGVGWTDNASTESGYVVEYSTNGSSWTQFTTTSANATSTTVTGLSAQTGYYFRVAAFNGYGTSSYSSISDPVYTKMTKTIVSAASTTIHELVFVDNKFFLIYSSAATSTVNNLYSVSSTDGTTWSDPEMILSDVLVGGDTGNTFAVAVNNKVGLSGAQEHMTVIAQRPSGQFYTVYYAPSYDWVTFPVVQTSAASTSTGRLHYAYSTSSYFFKAYGYNLNNTEYQFKSRRVPASFTAGSIDDIVSGQTNKLLGLAITGVTSSEVIHVAFLKEDTTDGNPSGEIKYASSSDFGATWTSSTVASGLSASLSGTYASFNSMAKFAMSPSGTMGLIFNDITSVSQVSGSTYDVTSTLYVYTKAPGAGWAVAGTQSQSGQETIASFTYRTPSLIFSSADYPITLYYNLSTGYPTLGYKRSTFDISTVSTSPLTGRNNLSIAYDESDRILISSFVYGTNINIVTSSINFVDIGLTYPTSVTTTARTTSSVTLGWGDASSSEVGYNISKSTDNSTFTSVATTSPNATSYQVTGLDSGRLYYFKVTAVGQENSYASTLTGGAYTKPVDSTLTIGSITSTTISITINTSTNHSSVLYAVYNSTSSGYLATDGSATSTETFATSTAFGSLSASGLTANTSYSFAITSKNSFGDRSSTSSVVSTTTLAAVPTITSASSGADYVVLSLSGTAESYQVYNVTVATSGDWSANTSRTISSLSCGTTYQFKVKARNSALRETGYSDTTSVTTSDCPSSGGGGGGYSPNFPPKDLPLPILGRKPIAINDAAKSTDSRNVTLSFAIEQAVQVAVSNDPTFKGSSFDPYVKEMKWTLTPGNGTKNVFARFRNESGATVDYSATIEFYSAGEPPVIPKEPKPVYGKCLPEGKPYKTVTSPKVYLALSDCTIKEIPDETTYFTYFDSWDKLITISQQELSDATKNSEALGYGPLYRPKSGTIVKAIGDARTYFLLGREKRYIKDESVFTALKFMWSWIVPVDSTFLDLYDYTGDITKTDIHPDQTLIKYEGKPEVYILEWGKKRKFLSEGAFIRRGYDWNKIITIPETETYPNGQDLK